eukprot:7009384-Pyramimonas_sp.AAC.1
MPASGMLHPRCVSVETLWRSQCDASCRLVWCTEKLMRGGLCVVPTCAAQHMHCTRNGATCVM